MVNLYLAICSYRDILVTVSLTMFCTDVQVYDIESMWIMGYRLWLWYLTPLSTIFQLYRGGQFYWWRKPEYLEKTTDLSQVTDKLLSHKVVSSTPRHERDSNSQLRSC